MIGCAQSQRRYDEAATNTFIRSSVIMVVEEFFFYLSFVELVYYEVMTSDDSNECLGSGEARVDVVHGDFNEIAKERHVKSV